MMNRYRFTSTMRVMLVGVVGLAFVGCTALTGKSAGRNIDDASITTAVKAKLAKDERLSTLTTIDVDTNEGVVYLNGAVTSEADRVRAAQLAREVKGVYGVTNNLTVRTGDVPAHKY